MADKVASDKVARITGQKSRSMAEHYQAHVAEEVIVELGVEAGQRDTPRSGLFLCPKLEDLWIC